MNEKQTKTLLYIGGALVAYKVLQPLLRGLGILETEPIKPLTPADNEVIKKAGGTSLLTAQEAKSIADGQLAALDGWGTDETALFSPLMALTGPDLAQVFVRFGAKWYDKYFGTSSWAWVPGAQQLNLFGWYSQELSGRDLQRMKSIWQKSKLKF